MLQVKTCAVRRWDGTALSSEKSLAWFGDEMGVVAPSSGILACHVGAKLQPSAKCSVQAKTVKRQYGSTRPFGATVASALLSGTTIKFDSPPEPVPC